MKDLVIPISSKGQITVPKSVRQRLGVELGSYMKITIDSQNRVVLQSEPSFQDYYGQLNGFWGSQDPVADVRALRGESTR